MRLSIFALLLVLGSQYAIAHGGHVAAFRYQIEPNSIELEFQIERIVLDHFDLAETCPSYQLTTALCLSQYIAEKTTIYIDNQVLHFELDSSRSAGDFFIVKMSAAGDFADYSSLRLQNECFLEFDRQFKNRIIIQRDGVNKSYLLDRQHTDIITD